MTRSDIPRSRLPFLRAHIAIRRLGLPLSAAIALLAGVAVLGASASRDAPTPFVVGDQQAEADPTPTLEPTPSPTPTPVVTPTPSPTPAPDPTAHIATVWIFKIVDADGDLDTVHDQTDGEGWEFELELTDGTFLPGSPATQVTDEVGGAQWLINDDPEGTTVTLTEMPQEKSELLDVSCMTFDLDQDIVLGELDGNSVTFRTELPAEIYLCRFFNAASPTAAEETRLAGIAAWKHIDADGELETFGDRQWPPTWEFQATFEDGVEILAADAHTRRDENAKWLLRHTGESTRVVLTEVPQNGYRILTASCIDADSSDGMEIPTTLEGNSLAFEVSGFETLSDEPHSYFCDFWNAPVDVEALPTLPPTHTASSTIPGLSESWRLGLVGLTALVTSVLVLKSHEPARRRR